MRLNEALQLIRAKYLEEQRGVSEGPVVERYKKACEQYPVMMNTAQGLWTAQMAQEQ